MKCTYRYPIHGNLKVESPTPVRLRHMDYEFEFENGIAKAIRITSSISEDEWPRYEPTNDPDVKFRLNLRNHRMLFIDMEVRGLESLLSLYGVTAIDTDNWEVFYTPENDDEKKALQITQFKQETRTVTPKLRMTIDHDTLTKAIAASVHAELGTLTYPLTFFRKARASMMEGRFIGAFYEFYFVLETLYGNGKTRDYAIKSELKKSQQLQGAAKEALDFAETNFADAGVRNAFVRKFQNYTPDCLIDHIVNTRGFLHHHTARNRKIWHPSKEKEYEIDALMIQAIAYHVLIEEMFTLFKDERVKADLP